MGIEKLGRAGPFSHQNSIGANSKPGAQAADTSIAPNKHVSTPQRSLGTDDKYMLVRSGRIVRPYFVEGGDARI